MPWIADLLLLAAIWGGSFLLMQWGAAAFGPWATAFLRVALASVLLLGLLAWRRQLPVLRAHARHGLIVGLLNSGVPFALFSYALLSLPSGLTSILNATTPLWGAVIGALWLGQRLSALRIVGLLIGLGGVIILSWDRARSGSSGSAWAMLACLGATLCYGIAASYTKRFLSEVPPLVTATGSQLGATLALVLPATLWMPALTGPTAPGLQAWLAVGALATLCTALAYILYFRLIQNAGPQRALTVTFLVPVFGVSYGHWLVNEPLTLHMLVGGTVVIAGTALSLGWFSRTKDRGESA